MRLAVKFLVVLLVAAVLPVLVVGILAVRASEAALQTATEAALRQTAIHLVERAERELVDGLESFRQSSSLPLATMTAGDRDAALWVLYRQHPHYNALVLVDGTTGESVGSVVHQAVLSDEPPLASHQIRTQAQLPRFAEHIPMQEALQAGKALGMPYAHEGNAPVVVFAVRVPESSLVLAAEVSLQNLHALFGELRSSSMTAQLMDATGKTVSATELDLAIDRRSRDDDAVLYNDAVWDDGSTFITLAKIPRLVTGDGRSWAVIVSRNREEALQPVMLLRERVRLFVLGALLFAVAAAWLLARGVVAPIERLSRAAIRFQQDPLSRVTATTGGDEVAMLGRSFNAMAAVVANQQTELRVFNTQLQARVDERTRELRDTQEQLIQSSKMAAVGSLGASIAHEINNPLAAVMGAAQLAMLRLPEGHERLRSQLEDIDRESLRIKVIVEGLMQMSTDKQQGVAQLVDVHHGIETALAMTARNLIGARITVRKELAAKPATVRGRIGELQQVVVHLVHNAQEAMPDGGVLTVRTEVVDQRLLRITVIDSGVGIVESARDRIFEPMFTTKAKHQGMGLAVAHRIVQEHGGRLSSEAGSPGTVMRISLPLVRDPNLL